MHLDPGESRRVEAASRMLDLLPANAPPTEVFDAIRPCVPVAAGLFNIIRPGADDALVSQPVRLPPGIFESWLRMPPDLLQVTLAPVVSSGAGKLWRDSETLRGAQREQLEVLRELHGAGLGEGAGYKLMERPSPWGGGAVEHLMLALLVERGERIPARAQVMLAALHERIQAAVLRLALPLLAHQPLYAQIVAEQSLGYICLSQSGRVLAANRRAHHLVERYRDAAGIQGLRGVVEEFAARAQELARRRPPWQLKIDRPLLTLQVDAHHLAKETHDLPEDTILLQMREGLGSPVAMAAPPAPESLTPREREIALLLARTEDSQKEIAARLGISPGTMRTHTQNIHRKLGFHSRAQLTVHLNKWNK